MDVFTLKATIDLDSTPYERGLDQAKQLAGSVFNGIKAVAKVGTAAIGLASAGVATLAKNSVDSYAEYEQMVGGVQKLYGNMGKSLEDYAKDTGRSTKEVKAEWQNLEKAQNIVLDNAKNAYKTAGISANQYMEMATSFSASLINSLGGDTVKAAEQTDVAMRAISDNFNTFGGDIGMIQGAFQGFAKQNYTMLDNLKLGYGGTKTEMERLIDDANEYAESIGQASDLSIDSFSDIVTAIDLIQQKQNIAGTTAREAGTTLQGSVGMVKAAWENLVTGMSDPDADIGLLINNMVDSASVAAENLLPTIEKALQGVGSLIEQVAPMISEKLPGLIEKVLPSLLNAATSLVIGVANALPSILKVLIEQAPSVLSQIGNALVEAAPALIQSGSELADTLLQAFWDGVIALKNVNFKDLADKIGKAITTLFDSENSALMGFGYAASRLIQVLGNGISEAIPELVPFINKVIANLADFITQEAPGLINTGVSLLTSLSNGIISALPELIPTAINVITTLASNLANQIPILINSAVDLIIGLATGLTNPDSITQIVDTAIKIVQKLADGIVAALPKLTEAAPIIIQNLMDAIVNNLPKLLGTALKIVVQLELGIIRNLPTLAKAAVQIVSTLITGIVNYFGKVFNTGVELVKEFKSGIQKLDPAKWGKDLIGNFINGIKNGWRDLKGTLGELGDMIADYIGFSEPEEGPLSNFHTYAPDMMKLFAKGVKDNTRLVTDQIQKSFDFSDVIAEQSVNVNQPVQGAETRTPGSVVINVYGAEGQDINALADEISYRLQHLYDVRDAVFA